MNYRMTVHILGKMLGVEGLVLFIPMLVALLYKEETFIYFPITSAILITLYLLFGRKKPKNTNIYI